MRAPATSAHLLPANRGINHFRLILVHWEKKPENDPRLLHVGCALITYHAAGLLG